MKEHFLGFDVTLKDLLHLERRAKSYDRLHDLFTVLKQFWYRLDSGTRAEEVARWNRVRIGSVDVYLDEAGHLHIDFTTRFTLKEAPQVLAALRSLGRAYKPYDLDVGPPFEPTVADDREYLNSSTPEPVGGS